MLREHILQQHPLCRPILHTSLLVAAMSLDAAAIKSGMVHISAQCAMCYFCLYAFCCWVLRAAEDLVAHTLVTAAVDVLQSATHPTAAAASAGPLCCGICCPYNVTVLGLSVGFHP